AACLLVTRDEFGRNKLKRQVDAGGEHEQRNRRRRVTEVPGPQQVSDTDVVAEIRQAYEARTHQHDHTAGQYQAARLPGVQQPVCEARLALRPLEYGVLLGT